jgi:hypothetical protein
MGQFPECVQIGGEIPCRALDVGVIGAEHAAAAGKSSRLFIEPLRFVIKLQ